MDAPAINTNNNIPNINNVSQNSAGNVGAAHRGHIDDNQSKDSNAILQSSLVLSKGELAQNLKKVNDGIMITSMADKGLQKQTDILKNVKENLIENVQDYKIDVDKNQVKQDVLNQLQEFTNISENLKYNDQALLDSTQNKTLEVNTINQTLELAVPSSKELGIEISNLVSRSDLSSQSLNSIITKIDSTLEQMDKFREEFTQTQRALVETAKGTIEDQSKESMRKSQVQDKNYGVETAEFSKANVNAIAGHLVASQANIPQSHGMRLLY